MPAALPRRSAFVRYGFAVAASLIAAYVRVLFNPLLGTRLAFLTFFPAVMFSGWFGGLVPGIVCTLVSAVVAKYFWFEPINGFGLINVGDVAAFGVFIGTGVLMSVLNESVHRGRVGQESARRVAEHAQRQAQAAERRWVKIIEATPTAMIAVNQRGIIVFVNSLSERLFGYQAGELMGKPVEALVPDRYRANHEQYRTGFSDAPEMRQMGVGRDLYAVRKDGTEVPVEIGLNPVDIDGEMLVLSSIVDISERKQAEAAQHRLHQLAMMPLARATMEEVLVGIVDAAITITHADFGNIQLVDPKSSDLRIATQRGFPQWWIDYWNTVSKGHGTCGTALERGERIIVEDVEQSPIFAGSDLEIQRKAGVRAIQSTPLISRSGTLIGMFSTHYRTRHRPDTRMLLLLDLLARQAADIIAQARAEEDRAHLLQVEQRARAEADAANRSKDVFLARVSHELRTPLNALMGWTRMLRDGSVTAGKVPNALASIDRNADVLNKLVEDLLDMSRLTSGKLQLDRKHLDIVAVVRESVHLLEPAADAKHIRLEARLDAESVTVDGDPTRLREVFWNLLSNAIKFTPDDGRVTVRAQVTDGVVEISVTDTGQGIAPEFASHIFEPFTQAESGGLGLGLGLAIVQQLVTAHDGRVHARSEGIGMGTTFTVSLPVVRMPEAV